MLCQMSLKKNDLTLIYVSSPALILSPVRHQQNLYRLGCAGAAGKALAGIGQEHGSAGKCLPAAPADTGFADGPSIYYKPKISLTHQMLNVELWEKRTLALT